MPKHAIVGIDPGATSAVCAIGLDGKLIGCIEAKEGGRQTISHMINELAIPSVIATDKNPAPDTVRKVAAGYNAALYVPMREQLEADKALVSRGMGFSSVHIRDAYAAALNAYNFYANKLRQIDSMGLENSEQVKHLVMQGTTIFNAGIISAARTPEAVRVQAGKIEQEAPLKPQELVERLAGEIAALSEKNSRLKSALAIAENEKLEIGSRLELLERRGLHEALRDREVRRLNATVERLQRYIAQIRGWGGGKKHGEKGVHGKENRKESMDGASGKPQAIKAKEGAKGAQMQDYKKEGIAQEANQPNLKTLDGKVDLEKILEDYRKKRG